MSGNLRIGPSHGEASRVWVLGVLAALTAGALLAGMLFGLSARTGNPRPAAVPQTAWGGHRQKGLRPGARARVTRGSPVPSVPTSGHRLTKTTAVRSVRAYVSDIAMSGSLLSIPSLHIRAPLVPTGAVGAPETASLTIPSDIREVGWWDGKVDDDGRIVQEDAPAPGQPGVAVIAGHVDSAAEGPGALFDLRALKEGDVIRLRDSTGHVSLWVVEAEPRTSLKTQLPPALWATSGSPKLALVTCGAPFDEETGHYIDNVIVWARQLSTPGQG